MNLQETIRHISKYFKRYSDLSYTPYRLVDGERIHVRFDPTSFDQVLVVSEMNEYEEEVILFACTEFGLYIREPGDDEPRHHFYHNLMQSQGDFGLTIFDLADCHYMVKNFPRTWDI